LLLTVSHIRSLSAEAYEEAFVALFDSLDWLEDLLSARRYLTGERVTEADWRLFTTLLRLRQRLPRALQVHAWPLLDRDEASSWISRWNRGISPYSRVQLPAIRLQLDAIIALGLQCGLRRGEVLRPHGEVMHPDNADVVAWKSPGRKPGRTARCATRPASATSSGDGSSSVRASARSTTLRG
jgi:integrase